MDKINPQAVLLNMLMLIAGWCFGHEIGLGVAAIILLLLHALARENG